jgi:hypothetical protein
MNERWYRAFALAFAVAWLTAAGMARAQEAKPAADPPGEAVAGGEAAESVPPSADDPELVAKIATLPGRTGMKLPAAKMRGKELEKWRNQFYRRGPVGRDYCVKMVYNPDRKTAFYCGGNHGSPHKLADAWEYHLGSNTWTLLAPPEVGDPRGIFGLYGHVRKGRETEALEMVRKHVILEDGCLVTRQTGGPINTLHTWDGLTYDPRVKRALWAAPATGIREAVMIDLYAKANNLTGDEVKAKLSPGMYDFWMYDFASNRWKRHVGPGPYPRRNFTITMTYIPDLGKTIFYGSYNRETWTYDAVANKWERIAVSKQGPGLECLSAYSPKHKKLVTVHGKNTWTFDPAKKVWTRVCHDKKNWGSDWKTLFVYDEGNDVFLLYQPTMPDKIRVYSLAENKWTTPEIKGDAPGGGRLQGYYDPDRNALVVCNGLSVWLYRYARHEAKDGE